MNKRYVAIDDKVLVYDENAEMSTRDNQKGIEKVLEQENIVEEIQENILSIQIDIDVIEDYYSNPDFKKLKMQDISYMALISLITFVFLLILAASTGNNALSLNGFIASAGFTALFNLPLYYMTLGRMHKSKKSDFMNKNALEAQLECLKEKEKIEVAKLNQMKQELAKQPIIKAAVSDDKKIDLSQLEKFREELMETLNTVYNENYELPEKGKQFTK